MQNNTIQIHFNTRFTNIFCIPISTDICQIDGKGNHVFKKKKKKKAIKILRDLINLY